MTPRKIRETVNSAWLQFERLAYRAIGSRDVDALLRQSIEAERGHRRFMRGGIRDGYHAGYRVSVDTAAKLIALNQLRSQLLRRAKPSFEACATVRKDVLTAWYCAEQLKRQCRRMGLSGELKALKRALEPVSLLDYAEDCAR